MSPPIPAYPARDVAKLIVSNRQLMHDYTRGCQSGEVQAVTHKGKNFVAVEDDAIRQQLEAAGPHLKRHEYDPESGTITPAG